jgi:Putative prokaryotic signal transducing protein
MNASTASVAVVNSRAEAELIVGLLKSAGVTAFVLADDAGGQEPQWQLSGGVRVMVPSPHAAAAKEVLDDARRREDHVD